VKIEQAIGTVIALAKKRSPEISAGRRNRKARVQHNHRGGPLWVAASRKCSKVTVVQSFDILAVLGDLARS